MSRSLPIWSSVRKQSLPSTHRTTSKVCHKQPKTNPSGPGLRVAAWAWAALRHLLMRRLSRNCSDAVLKTNQDNQTDQSQTQVSLSFATVFWTHRWRTRDKPTRRSRTLPRRVRSTLCSKDHSVSSSGPLARAQRRVNRHFQDSSEKLTKYTWHPSKTLSLDEKASQAL